MVWTSAAVCGLCKILLDPFCNLGRVDRKKLIEAQKTSQNITREANNIKALMETQAEKIEELVRIHHVKLKKIKEMIGAESHYKKEQKVNFHNALIHIKGLEINTGMVFTQLKMRQILILFLQTLIPERNPTFLSFSDWPLMIACSRT